MMTSMDGQLTPGTYKPLRFTFLIWVMVIVGGSGNNWGAVLGGLLIGWLWLVVENVGPQHRWSSITAGLPDGVAQGASAGQRRAYAAADHGGDPASGLRFSPRGLIPEK